MQTCETVYTFLSIIGIVLFGVGLFVMIRKAPNFERVTNKEWTLMGVLLTVGLVLFCLPFLADTTVSNTRTDTTVNSTIDTIGREDEYFVVQSGERTYYVEADKVQITVSEEESYVGVNNGILGNYKVVDLGLTKEQLTDLGFNI